MKEFFLVLFFTPFVLSEEKSYEVEIENGLEKFCNAVNFVTGFLEDFNDRHLGESEWGKMLGYKDFKPVIRNNENNRGMKKMSMAMMPLVFHVGATSSFMILTAIMAAKSVLIGLILLVFKIAVSSAKVASFFTQLKSKQAERHEYSWNPHGHIGSDRSLNEIPSHGDWSSYTPEWSYNKHAVSDYKTVPTYKENQISYTDIDYEEPTIYEKKSR